MQRIKLPKVIFGTSRLGNLYAATDQSQKCAGVAAYLKHSKGPVVFDSAGKYGAGLALESLGQCLRSLKINPDKVVISNKLGWYRIPLNTEEPTFEPGVWKCLSYDAVQSISYDGILACYEQGNLLLDGYHADLVSVHDPDEYLAAAINARDRQKRYQDILAAYRALQELRTQGRVKAVGVGAKDWRIIEKITRDVTLDWVMIANSLTVHHHPSDLLVFMQKLKKEGVTIINAAVFNGGFLVGADHYNYKPVSSVIDKELYWWRSRFHNVCAAYNVQPATACALFGLYAPGVQSIALSAIDPEVVAANIAMVNTRLPPGFWETMKEQQLIDSAYPSEYLP